MNMIEKVAIASLVAIEDAQLQGLKVEGNYSQRSEFYKFIGKRILEAIREPTEEMLFAGTIDLGSGGELDNKNLTEVYQLMIDAALNG